MAHELVAPEFVSKCPAEEQDAAMIAEVAVVDEIGEVTGLIHLPFFVCPCMKEFC